MPRAGLAPDVVTEAAAALADDVGFDQISMGLLAERLGVRTPSLYKHVNGLADVNHRVAVLALTEVGDAVRDAMQGLAGRDALAAAAHAIRAYAQRHPGRYAATADARTSGPDDPLLAASERVLRSFAAILQGYRLDPDQQIHAMRMLRSVVHGFVTLEAAGGFQMGTDIEESFTWMLDLADQGLQATVAART